MRRSVSQSLPLRASAVGCLAMLIFAMSAVACELATTVRDATLEDIKTFFVGEKKAVVTFVGYSGAEYEDKATMLQTADNLLEEFDPAKTIINIGATHVGIGAVYALAKRKGFLTTGIVSALAKEDQAALSPCVDYVFYVPDTAWGGFIEGSQRLSPTSAALVENSDEVIGIGGGEAARDELLEAKRRGKKIRFIPADMHHQKAREKAQKAGLPVPTQFGGAAGEVF